MAKSVKKNYMYNLIYQILAIIVPIITTPYLSRTLGSESIGTFSFTNSIATYFMLFGALGISLYGQREIAYNQSDKKKLSKTFWELVIFKIFTMTVAIIIYYLLFARTGEFSLYYKLLLFQLFANVLDIGWLYQGLEDFKKITIRNFIIKIITVISIFIFIKNPSDIIKYIIIYSVSIFLGNFVLWINLKGIVNKIKFSELNIKRHIKPIFILFIPQIAIQIYVLLDKTMIGAITKDMSEVGYYEQSQKIVKILLAIITSMGIVMLPRISNYFSEGRHKEIKEYLYKSFNFALILAFPMVVGLIAISNNFVPIFYGSGFDKVKILLPLMSVVIIFISMSNIIGNQFLLPTKKQKAYTISVICGAIINFILNILLISKFLSIGACISTIIAELSVVLIQIWFVRKEFEFNFIFKSFIKYLILSLIMLIIIYPIGLIINNNMLAVIIQIILGLVIYITELIIVKDQFFNNYFITLLNKIKNQKTWKMFN